METSQVSRLKKKMDSLFSANQIRENKWSANQSKASIRVRLSVINNSQNVKQTKLQIEQKRLWNPNINSQECIRD